MEQILEHFGQVEEHFRTMDSLLLKQDKLERKQRKKNYFGFPLIILLIGIIWEVMGKLGSRAGEPLNSVQISGIVIMLISIPAFIIGFVISRNRNNEIYDINDKCDRIGEAILDWYDEYPQCPIGVEYCHPDTLAILYDYLRKGRAETIKEALNLFANDQHNAEMKQIAIQTRNLTDLLYMNSVQ